MPHSFFILYRLFLRVDNVLFRIYDVRIYHKFGSGEVLKELLGMEADYDTIKSVSLYLLILDDKGLMVRNWTNPTIYHH